MPCECKVAKPTQFFSFWWYFREDVDFGQRLTNRNISVEDGHVVTRDGGREDGCIRDAINGAPEGTDNSANERLVGDLNSAGLSEVNYILVSTESLVSDTRGKVTLLRFKLPE